MYDGIVFMVIIIIVLIIRLIICTFKIYERDDIIYNYRNQTKFIHQYRDKILKDADIKIKATEKELARKKKEAEAELNECMYQVSLKKEELAVLNSIGSNVTALPYMAHIFAEFETRNIELYAAAIDWGKNAKRLEKVKNIRSIRKEAIDQITKCKEAEYQLEYAIRMFPALEDFINTDYRDLTNESWTTIEESHQDIDRASHYLSQEEYQQLSITERNQLALDRYRESHRKSNWQIGRDYELYVGYKYELKGYTVSYNGSLHQLSDLGRDLIAKKDDTTLIIQCKYWSSSKQIHEKHINQLYGTMMAYCFENGLPAKNVHGVLVTNITFSDTAKKFAEYLGIDIVEKFPLGNYPCIKCNVNHNSEGDITKIYHLPFDQQYDSCVINQPGEFMALTVAEAEAAGFRRAHRWHGK